VQATTVSVVLLAMVGIAVIVLAFMRDRARKGIKPFQITDKDKVEARKFAAEFAPRKLTGQLLGSLGMLLIIASLYPSDSTDVTWKTNLFIAATGVCLVFVGTLLVRPPRARPPYWRTAVWGTICSGCFLLLIVCVVYVVRTPREEIPRWVKTVTFLLIVTATLSAIACFLNGVKSFLGQKSNENAVPDPADRSGDKLA